MKKICNVCEIEKELIFFYKKKGCRFGVSSICRECQKKKSLNNYKENQELRKIQMKKWRDENKEHLKQYESKRCKTKKRKELAKKNAADRYIKNKKEILNKNAKWAKENPDKQYKRTRRWRQDNKELVTSYVVKYKAQKLNATLEGYDAEIKEIYKNCPEGYEVDHIMPLQGNGICGLHVPWNLQYLTPYENKSKSNKIVGEL